MKTIIRISLFFFSVIILCNCSSNSADEIDENIVKIPDEQFLNALIAIGVDTNSDGLISVAEAIEITSLELIDRNITDMTGIEAFVNLEVLFCVVNHLSSLNLSNNIALTHLECSYNILTSLDLSKNTALTILYCFDNQLTSLDLKTHTQLFQLGCVCDRNKFQDL